MRNRNIFCHQSCLKSLPRVSHVDWEEGKWAPILSVCLSLILSLKASRVVYRILKGFYRAPAATSATTSWARRNIKLKMILISKYGSYFRQIHTPSFSEIRLILLADGTLPCLFLFIYFNTAPYLLLCARAWIHFDKLLGASLGSQLI